MKVTSDELLTSKQQEKITSYKNIHTYILNLLLTKIVNMNLDEDA